MCPGLTPSRQGLKLVARPEYRSSMSLREEAQEVGAKPIEDMSWTQGLAQAGSMGSLGSLGPRLGHREGRHHLWLEAAAG